jgi:hypothetical protein
MKSLKGGLWGYEAYEVKKKDKIYAVFYFAGKRTFFFMKSLLHRKKKNTPQFTTADSDTTV